MTHARFTVVQWWFENFERDYMHPTQQTIQQLSLTMLMIEST